MSNTTNARKPRRLSALLIGLVVLGIALLIANVPGSPLRNGDLELFVLFGLPLAVSLVAYVRFAEPVVRREVALLTLWGLAGVVVTIFVTFLATTGRPPRYGGAELELGRNVALFLAATVGLGVPYGVAGYVRRDHPRRAVLSAVLGAFVLFGCVVTVATAI